jgi:hypothetical protein
LKNTLTNSLERAFQTYFHLEELELFSSRIAKLAASIVEGIIRSNCPEKTEALKNQLYGIEQVMNEIKQEIHTQRYDEDSSE